MRATNVPRASWNSFFLGVLNIHPFPLKTVKKPYRGVFPLLPTLLKEGWMEWVECMDVWLDYIYNANPPVVRIMSFFI